jgi:hypothetical protein
MADFTSCLAMNNLGSVIDEQYGRWGHFHEEAARMIQTIAKEQAISPELLAVTWLNESTFGLYPKPNTNHYPDPMKWDIGPMQLNRYWTKAERDVGRIHAFDEFAVFGGVEPGDFFDDEGQPVLFRGDPLSNLRVAAQRLRVMGGNDHVRVVAYTGPAARPAPHHGLAQIPVSFSDVLQQF